MWEKYWWAFAIGGAVIAFIIFAVIIAVVINNKKKNADKLVDKVAIKDGVRYTKDKEIIDESGNTKISHAVGDIILERGEVYTVEKDGLIIPGKYTVLASDENCDTFTIRIADRVREYKHASSIVLAEGDKISPRSNNIILR